MSDMQLSPGQGTGRDRVQNGHDRTDRQATLARTDAGGSPAVEVTILRAVVSHMDGPTTDSLYEIDADTIADTLTEQGYQLSPQRVEQHLRELRTFAELVGSNRDAPSLTENMRQREAAERESSEESTDTPAYDDPEVVVALTEHGAERAGYTVPREKWANYLREYVTAADAVHHVGGANTNIRLGFDPTTPPTEKSDIMPSDETVDRLTEPGESRGELNKAVLWFYGALIGDSEVALAARKVLWNHRRRLINWAATFPGVETIRPSVEGTGNVGAYTGYSSWTAINQTLTAVRPLLHLIRSDEDATRECTAAIIEESDPRLAPADADQETRPIDAEVYLDLIERVGTDYLDERLPLADASWEERKEAVAAYIQF